MALYTHPQRSPRQRLIDRARGLLLRRSSPRWHMALMVLLTGAFGLLMSWALLQ